MTVAKLISATNRNSNQADDTETEAPINPATIKVQNTFCHQKDIQTLQRKISAKMEYQRGTSDINLESDHSETEALCPDATHQKIQGRQNVWCQTTPLHDGN